MSVRAYTAVAVLALTVLVGPALATPAINSAVITPRVFNDAPASTLTTVNNYPSVVGFDDRWTSPGNFANLHNFRLSEDGSTQAVFNNGDAFAFSSDLTLTGRGEAGLNVAPWWAQQFDGKLNVRAADGEIAAFGGRLPFFSFTANFGVIYTPGQLIRLGVAYDPHSLNVADPATIEYTLAMGGSNYTSGPLAFDQGNPAEDPPYGLWGMLNEARVGGYLEAFVSQPEGRATAVFGNLSFTGPSSPVAIPEPLSLVAVGLGACGLGRYIRRRAR